MKKLFQLVVVVLAMAVAAPGISAQTQKQIAKERKALVKATKQELNEKATKAARKEAKKLKKQGWLVTPGTLPMDKQLDRAYLMQYEYTDDLYPVYIMSEAMSIGENYDAAKVQALELAKQNLAGQIQTGITTMVENTVANKQLSEGEAASVVETVTASKNIISQSLGRILPVMECYRTTKKGNKEVLVRVAYNRDMAMAQAQKVVKEELEKKGESLHTQLDKVLGF